MFPNLLNNFINSRNYRDYINPFMKLKKKIYTIKLYLHLKITL